MPISVNWQPPASVIGAAGAVAGQGQYNKWAAEQAQRQQQINQQYELERRRQQQALALAIAGNNSEMARTAMGVQAGLAGRAMDNAAQRQGMFDRANLGAAQSILEAQLAARRQGAEFAQQKDLIGVKAAADVWQTQQDPVYQEKKRQNLYWMKQSQNPFAEYDAQVQAATNQGLSFSPQDQQRVTKMKAEIGRLVEDHNAGRLTTTDFLPAYKREQMKLRGIMPSTKQLSPQEELQQNFGTLPDPVSGRNMGFLRDSKGNWKQVKPVADQALQDEAKAKAAANKAIADVKAKWMSDMRKHVADRTKPGSDPATGASIPSPVNPAMAAQEYMTLFPMPETNDKGDIYYPQPGTRPGGPAAGAPAAPAPMGGAPAPGATAAPPAAPPPAPAPWAMNDIQGKPVQPARYVAQTLVQAGGTLDPSKLQPHQVQNLAAAMKAIEQKDPDVVRIYNQPPPLIGKYADEFNTKYANLPNPAARKAARIILGYTQRFGEDPDKWPESANELTTVLSMYLIPDESTGG